MKTIKLQTVSALLALLACTGCSNSGNTEFDGLLGQQPSSGPGTGTVGSVALAGPETVAPGVNTTSFVATYKPGTRGAVNPGVSINLSADGNGGNAGNIVVISPCGDGGLEQPPSGGGMTDRQGEVCFGYTAPSSVVTPTSITLLATVPGQFDAANNPLMTSLMLTVQPATFRFVPPSSNNIGFSTSQPVRLRFQWTQISRTGTGTEGVTGKMQLSATGGGQFTVDGVAASSVIMVDTNGGNGTGDFAKTIGIYATSVGAINVTAVDQSNGRTSTLALQAKDMPSGITLAATPRQIPTAGAEGSSTTLTATVSGEGPSDGSAVTFTLSRVQEGSSERLSFTNGKTNKGQIVTQYFSGDRAGTAFVEACVDNTTVCASETITVVSP